MRIPDGVIAVGVIFYVFEKVFRLVVSLLLWLCYTVPRT